ncbi:MAG: hypothetical protein HOM25_00645 [Rhodospirillaceae bacterium]|nr:hypothetical protein [Rhodospirillaceae bacterium]MBT5664973.1 hypothetical protein [Rhodospirillaceae bacterium]MBT5810915.1 hypothetical protein [Rhodospirillaceae bacterium]
MKQKFTVLLGLILLLVASPATAKSGILNMKQLTALFSEEISYRRQIPEFDIYFVYKGDGTWTAEKDTGHLIWGTWRIEDNAVCRTFDGFEGKWRILRATPCMKLRREGDKIFLGRSNNELEFEDAQAVARLSGGASGPKKLSSSNNTAELNPDQTVSQERERLSQTAALERQKFDVEQQRLTEERAQLSQTAAVEREKIDAERRALERMRIQFETQKLRQQSTMLEQQRAAAAKQNLQAVDTAPPTIQAATTLKTRDETLTIDGRVSDDTSVIRVEINGKSIAFNVRDGKFSTQTPVPIGQNNIRISAFDARGNKSEHIVAVTRTRDIPDIEFGAYHALVIGINDYKSLPKLNTALADARAVAKSLKERYNFTVTLLENPSRSVIIDAFDELRETLDEDDNLLIYYAGHGWLDQQSKRGYWLPVDAKSDRRSRWLSNSDLTDALQAILAKHVMVVADSCFSGTLTRSIKVPARNPAYMKRMAEKRARVVLSSGGLEPVSDSGGGEHSIFAAQFLNALNENSSVMDGTQLFESVRQKVVLNAQQTPEYSDIRLAGHEGGDFLFVRQD